jgi:hypothetical protein
MFEFKIINWDTKQEAATAAQKTKHIIEESFFNFKIINWDTKQEAATAAQNIDKDKQKE